MTNSYSFSSLQTFMQAKEMEKRVLAYVDLLHQMIENVIYDKEVVDKFAVVDSATKEFMQLVSQELTRVDQEPSADEPVLPIVPESDPISPIASLQEVAGEWVKGGRGYAFIPSMEK